MSVGGSGFGFGFGIKRPDSIILKRGESVIISYWNWWPPGWKQKLISVDSSGETTSKLL